MNTPSQDSDDVWHCRAPTYILYIGIIVIVKSLKNEPKKKKD